MTKERAPQLPARRFNDVISTVPFITVFFRIVFAIFSRLFIIPHDERTPLLSDQHNDRCMPSPPSVPFPVPRYTRIRTADRPAMQPLPRSTDRRPCAYTDRRDVSRRPEDQGSL